MNEREHLGLLLEAEKESQGQYDKTVLALAGGAIGISFAFLTDIVGGTPEHVGWVLTAWITWACSIATCLLSFGASTLAFRKAIKQFVSGQLTNLGGGWKLTTSILNVAAGVLLMAGILFLVIFVAKNLQGNG